MSVWEYKDASGDKLMLTNNPEQHDCYLYVETDSNVHITAEDAPVVAQAILAMSKADATVVPGKLPEVTIEEVAKGIMSAVVRAEDGMYLCWDLNKESIAPACQVALATLAIANRIEEYFDSEEHTEKVLQERRDAVVSQHGMGLGAYRYSELNKNGRHIVDTIIDLQDKLAAKEQSA